MASTAPSGKLQVLGHADSSGSEVEDKALADRRANVAAEHLSLLTNTAGTGPHKLLEGLLNEMVNEDKRDFGKVIRQLKQVGLTKEAESLQQQVTLVLEGLEPGVREETRIFWDLAPRRIDGGDSFAEDDPDRPNIEKVRPIIGSEWALYDDRTLRKLVQHCKH